MTKTDVVKPKTGWVYIRKNKTKPGEPGTWSEKKKLEVVTTYLTTGNMALVSRLCNVPYETIAKWKQMEWWNQLTDKYYEEDNIALSSQLSKTLDKTIAVINDRIADGDYEYDRKTGKLRRVPVKLRDAHRVASDLIDKQAVLRKQKTAEVVSNESTSGRLLKLAEAFAAFATGKQQEEKVISEIYEGDFKHLPENYQEAMRDNNAINGETLLKVQDNKSTDGILTKE